jgi:hypothetical protein
VRHREREYARAIDASMRWLGHPVPPDIADLIRHAVDMLVTPPETVVHWLERGTRSEELVRPVTGVAIYASRSIVCPPIVDIDSGLTF